MKNLCVPIRMASAIVALIGLTACANRQVIDSALKQALENNALLAKEQARTSAALAATSTNAQDLLMKLGAIINDDCMRLNESRGNDYQLVRDSTSFRLKTTFDDAAFRALGEFTVKFTETYRPKMQAEANTLNAQITKLIAEGSNDLARNLDVSDKKAAVISIARRYAEDNVRARDSLLETIGRERSELFAKIDAQLATPQGPVEDCVATASDLDAAAQALAAQSASLATYQVAAEALYASQQGSLEAVRAYANRLTFYKLILQGAKEGALDEVRGLSENFQIALGKAETRLDGLLSNVGAQAASKVSKIGAQLGQQEAFLSRLVDAAIGEVRSAAGQLGSGTTTKTTSTSTP
jgi:hypothetical protein